MRVGLSLPPAGEGPSTAPRARSWAESELKERGGTEGFLCRIASALRRAAKDVAETIEGIAWDMDREKRGKLCVGARQDRSELLDTIRGLLTDPLLDEEGQQWLREKLSDDVNAARVAFSQSQPAAPSETPKPPESREKPPRKGSNEYWMNRGIIPTRVFRKVKRKPKRATKRARRARR